jgi:hypothetical protein
VPANLFWYRVHAGQELAAATEFELSATYADLWRILTGPDCPLRGPELVQAKRNWVFRVTNKIASMLLGGNLRLALFTVRESGIGALEWIQYLFSGWRRRSMLAGVPLDEKGEYIVPDPLLPKTVATPNSFGQK